MSRQRLQELSWGSERFSLQKGPLLWLCQYRDLHDWCLWVRLAALLGWQESQVPVPSIFQATVDFGYSPFNIAHLKTDWAQETHTDPAMAALCHFFTVVDHHLWYRGTHSKNALLEALSLCLCQMPHKPSQKALRFPFDPNTLLELQDVSRGDDGARVWLLREHCRYTLFNHSLPSTHRAHTADYLEEMLSRGYVLGRPWLPSSPPETAILVREGEKMRVWEWALLEAKEDALIVMKAIQSRFLDLWQINYKEQHVQV